MRYLRRLNVIFQRLDKSRILGARRIKWVVNVKQNLPVGSLYKLPENMLNVVLIISLRVLLHIQCTIWISA